MLQMEEISNWEGHFIVSSVVEISYSQKGREQQRLQLQFVFPNDILLAARDCWKNAGKG